MIVKLTKSIVFRLSVISQNEEYSFVNRLFESVSFVEDRKSLSRSANVGDHLKLASGKTIAKLKRRHYFPYHCKTYDFTKFRNF
jgi:hypothetical protein